MVFVMIGAILVGVTLGLLGSGGSILTIPVLVLLLQRPNKLAIAESLAIVGCVALFAAIPYATHKQIHWRSVLFFGLAGMFGAYLGACGSHYCPGTIQMILFAIVMLAASWCMLFWTTSSPYETGNGSQPTWRLIVDGLLVGSMTGLVGVGGGFLIVPALVLLSRLPMRLAVGTSLVIIAMNAFTGFAVQQARLDEVALHVDWLIIAIFAIIGVAGSFLGSYIGSKLPQETLRRVFALFIVPVSLYILYQQYTVIS